MFSKKNGIISSLFISIALMLNSFTAVASEEVNVYSYRQPFLVKPLFDMFTKESGVSAGVRRIEAVCGSSAISYAKSFMNKYHEVQAEVKNQDAITGIKKLKDQIKELKKELEESQSQTAAPINETMIGDVKVVVDVVKNGDIKKIVDDLKNANEKLAVLLLQPKGEKVMIVAGSKNSNIKAGDWIKNIAPIVGGGGGGRPDFAQAGGKDVTKVEDAKVAAIAYANENL